MPSFCPLGGRKTLQSIHYLTLNGVDTPVHLTEFAKDSVFAYENSYLPKYVEEKTRGEVPESQVHRFVLEDIREGKCAARLLQLTGNACGVVDSETQDDMDRFAADVLTVAAQAWASKSQSSAGLQ